VNYGKLKETNIENCEMQKGIWAIIVEL